MTPKGQLTMDMFRKKDSDCTIIVKDHIPFAERKIDFSVQEKQYCHM